MYETAYNSGGIGAFFWLFCLGLYLYFAFTQYKIAQKVGCKEKAWWSFVPVLQWVLMVEMAGKEWWWLVLTLIPIINIAAYAIIWMEIARAAGYSNVWGLLVLVPFLNLVALGVMAFSGNASSIDIPTSGQIDLTRRKTTAV
ncbi:MAG TPA: DUF5684 domain-containing protein [candidate division Zixibacteria bacterium]|nr:DUF5684 domain-containing protein [candidate division Zixibacteria bacterium]